MKPVCHLDEDNTDVLAHRQQQLAEVLGLCRGAVAEDTARDFCQPLDNLRHLVAEVGAYVLYSVLGVLDYVVQQGRANRRRAQAYFLAGDFGHRDGVQYVGLARTAAYAGVGVLGKAEGAFDHLHLLAVVAGEIPVEHVAECVVNHAVLLGGGQICVVSVHNAQTLCNRAINGKLATNIKKNAEKSKKM